MKKASVAVLLSNEKGEIYLTKRSEKLECYPGYYGFPGGKIEVGETSLSAAQRELKEETGLDFPLDKFYFLGLNERENEYLCVIYSASVYDSPLKNMEPLKHDGWKAYSVEDVLELPKTIPGIKSLVLTACRKRSES